MHLDCLGLASPWGFGLFILRLTVLEKTVDFYRHFIEKTVTTTGE